MEYLRNLKRSAQEVGRRLKDEYLPTNPNSLEDVVRLARERGATGLFVQTFFQEGGYVDTSALGSGVYLPPRAVILVTALETPAGQHIEYSETHEYSSQDYQDLRSALTTFDKKQQLEALQTDQVSPIPIFTQYHPSRLEELVAQARKLGLEAY